MPAGPGEFQLHVLRQFAPGRDHAFGHERVVPGLDQQRRHVDGLQKLPGTAARVIIVHPGKAVQRRSHPVVEAEEIIESPEPGEVNRTIKRTEFSGDFPLQQVKQAALVDPGKAFIEPFRPFRQDIGHGNGGRSTNLYLAICLSQVFQKGVTSQRIACCCDGDAGIPFTQVFHQEADVAGVSGMVTARQAVMLAAATAEMHEHAMPAASFNSRQQRLHVMGVDTAFKPMKDRHNRSAGIRGQAQVDKIPIRQFEPFTGQIHLRPAPEEIRPQGLKITARQPPCRFEPACDHLSVFHGPPLYRRDSLRVALVWFLQSLLIRQAVFLHPYLSLQRFLSNRSPGLGGHGSLASHSASARHNQTLPGHVPGQEGRGYVLSLIIPGRWSGKQSLQTGVFGWRLVKQFK